MEFTEQEKQFLIRAKEAGKTPQEALDFINKKRGATSTAPIDKIQSTGIAQKSGFLSGVTSALGKAADVVGSGVSNVVAGGYEAAGNLAGLAGKGLKYVPGMSPYAGMQAEQAGEAIQKETKQGSEYIKGQAKEAFGEHKIAEPVGEFVGEMIPAVALGSEITGALPQLAKEAPKIAKAAQFLGKSAVSTGATKGAVTGELPTGKELATGAAIDTALYGTGAAISKYFDPKRLIKKSLGMTTTQVNKLDPIAKKAGYEDFSDWALKKGFKGSRDEMVDKSEQLLSDAMGSKKEVLKGIETKTKNTFGKLIGYLEGKYTTLGQEDVLEKIATLKGKKLLSAVDLDDLRSLADKTLPRGAYSGAEPVVTEGVEKMINPIRKILEGLDTTGEIVKSNTDIRILQKMIGAGGEFLKKASQKDVLGQVGVKGAIGGMGTALASWLGSAGLTTPIAALGASEAVLAIPQVSSQLAQTIKTIGEKESTQLIKQALEKAIEYGSKRAIIDTSPKESPSFQGAQSL